MKVLVASGAPPFAKGGAEILLAELCAALQRAGHRTDAMLFRHRPFGGFTAAYLHARLANVHTTQDGAAIDQIISLKYPAYTVRHPRHVCLMLHRFRPYYDLWAEFYHTLPNVRTRAKETLRRRLIHLWDRRALKRCTRLFAVSREVQSRLEKSGHRATVLYPPPRYGLEYGISPPGDYFLCVSRMDRQKRIGLFLKALALVPASRGIIVGDGPLDSLLKQQANELGVRHQVSFVGRVTDSELTEYYRNALAIVFCPHQEEFGYVALEGMSFAKPVITAWDSGGPTELISSGVTGWIVDPEPESIAPVLRDLLLSKKLAAQVGAAAFARHPTPSWPEALRKLVLEAPSSHPH